MSERLLFLSTAISVLAILASISLLVIGAVTIDDIEFIASAWQQTFSLSICSVVIGALGIVLVAALIYVANNKFPALTILFSVFMFVMFILTAVCLNILAVALVDLRPVSSNNVIKIFSNYSETSVPGNSNELVGRIQQKFRCCGIKEAADWEKVLSNGHSTPDSCCKMVVSGCGNNALITKQNIYDKGCTQSIHDSLQQRHIALIANEAILMALLLAIAVLGLLSEQYFRQQYQTLN